MSSPSPLCNLHHRELHDHGDERGWWTQMNINTPPFARELWISSRGWARPAQQSPTEKSPSC
jgi:hypothetical protein